MDKLTQYKKIVEEVLQNHVHLPTRDFPNVKDILVIDKDKKHFLQISMGWDREQYAHDTIYHLEVKDNGKIWIHELNTDVEVREELIEKGVAAEDIIRGMIAPYTLEEADEVSLKGMTS